MEKINKIQLGERIRELRTAAGHTQDDLAALLNKHRQVISYYENGTRTPNLSELITIAQEYKTTTDYLLGLSEVATIDTEIKAICDYTGLSDEAVNTLHHFNKDLFNFINDMIDFADANKYIIGQFAGSKRLLLHLFNAGEDTEKYYTSVDNYNISADAYTEWKGYNNELLFTNSQFRLQSAFNKYINNDEIVKATAYFDKLENELIKNNIKREKELETINKIANEHNYMAWPIWFNDNKENFKTFDDAKKWLSNFNITVSDDTLDFIMLVMKE